MRRAAILSFTAVLAACAGRLYSTTNATASAAPDAVYACAMEQLKRLEYQRTQYDPTDRWFVAQRSDPKAQVSDVRFRKRIDRLDVRVRPDASGNSSLEIKAQTFDVSDTQRGITETEQSASTRVKLDAASLAEACGL